VAQDLIEDWIESLAIGTGNLINIFNPSRVILAGGLSAAFQQIKPKFMEILLREAFEPSLKYCEVVVSQLQERAALIGAALWAQQQHHHGK
jgi:predicted NBD/HSP70 family sugar kinase